VGYYLKELAFIEEGPKYIMEPNLVNVEKIKKVARILKEINEFQNRNYSFKPVFKLAMLADPQTSNDEELGDLSLKLGKILLYLEPKFTLSKSKNLSKRPTRSDILAKSNSLSKTFNEMIEILNKDKSNKNLKDRIEMYFKNN
jgi:hypothetical protein